MNDDEVRRTLLLEAHRCVDSAADAAVAKIGLRRSRPAPKDGEIDTEALLIYPPNNSLSLEKEQAIRSMEGAHLSSLQAIRNHNKAQVRLMVLMGAAGHNAVGAHSGAAGPDCPPPH